MTQLDTEVALEPVDGREGFLTVLALAFMSTRPTNDRTRFA
jgi:hypothetical protein